MQTQHKNPYRPLQKSYAKHLYMSFNANTKLIVRDASVQEHADPTKHRRIDV